MRTPSLALAALLGLAVAAPAAAAPAAPAATQAAPAAAAPAHAKKPRVDRYARLLQRADTDHDGAVSQAEAAAYADSRFDRLDKAHQGYRTLDGWGASRRHRIEQASAERRPRLERSWQRFATAFKAMDKDGDGKLTKAEYLADSRARFVLADADHDGKLSLAELHHAHGHAF